MVLAAWVSGALAGAVHAVSGPDHLAALIPLCMGKGVTAFKEGAIWGLGHGLGCSIMGFFGVIFKRFINIHVVSEYMEFVVGFTLIVLGFLGIRRSQKWKEHDHEHSHEHHHSLLKKYKQNKNESMMTGDIENNLNSANDIIMTDDNGPKSIMNKFADCLESSPLITILITGIIHGFSGTGHILGVIPALTYKDIKNGMQYLSAFCVGTAVSMSIFTMFVGLIGVLITYTLKKDIKKTDDEQYNRDLPAIISYYASIFSVIVGIIWIVQPLIHSLI